jgi:hypothetical protein
MQEIYMTSLNDTITTSSGCDTITFTMDGDLRYGIPAFDTITLSDYVSSSTASGIYNGTMMGTAPYTISNSSITGMNGSSYYTGTGGYWNQSYNGKPFEDNFPEWNAFRELCDEYPGLERAYQNLKTFYTMCHADSLLPKDDK